MLDLVEYVEHMARLSEKAVFALGEYRQLIYHEADLKGRVGVRHDLSDEDGPIWLSIDRLKRIAPPIVPEDIEPWITVAADPITEPIIETVRTETIPRVRAEQLIEEGVLYEEDAQPAMRPDRFGDEGEQTGFCDVIFRLQNLPDVDYAVRAYVEGPWREWAEAEKPRRETIKIYDNYFSLQQSIQAMDGEQGLELVWGMGMVRWRLEDGRIIDHPVVEQLAEIDMDTLSGRINIRPRSTEPNVPLKPFFAVENPGADQVRSFAKDFFTRFKEDEDLSPFNGETFESILREVAMRMHGEARYHPDDLSDITDRTLPQIDKTLRVTNTWVVFARQRSDNFFINDLVKLKEAVEESEDLPGPARRLVTQPSTTSPYVSPIIDTGQGGQSGGGDTATSPSPVSEIEATRTEEFFFPKPFNDDQISIIHRLDEADGVVVQGPPGTGKTHTIANIICHYLATGRRVLVTSKGEAALTVLRDHIPKGIQNLTISLLTNERAGLKQLEQAVSVLSNTATQLSPRHLERDIKADQQRIGVLRKNIRKIDKELGEVANRHLKTVGDGAGILPMELAQEIVGGRESHEWLPDHPGPETKYDPQFSEEDVAAAREARKALGENLLYLGKALPSVSDLPDAAMITAVHEDLVRAKRLDEAVTHHNVPVLSLSTPRATERAGKLLEAIERIVSMFKDLELEPWLQGITEIWRDKGVRSDEVKLFNDLLPTARDLTNRRRDIVGNAVVLPEGADGDTDLFDGVARTANGSRPFGLVPFGKSEARARYGRIRIEGHQPNGAEEWKKVAEALQWRRDMIAFVGRWTAVKAEHDLPTMEGDVDDMARWLSNVVRIIDQVTVVLDEDRGAIEKDVPDLFPYGMSVSDILASRQEAEKAVETIRVNLSKNRLTGSRDKIDELLERLATCSGPIVDALKEFVAKPVGDQALQPPQITDGWQDLCRQLSDLLNLRPQMDTIERVAGLVAESGAPNWAEKLQNEPVSSGEDVWTPIDWRKTWNWRRQETYLKRIDGRDRIRELAETHFRHEGDLRKTFQKVVENRTFLSLKTSMTERVESALVMFTSAIRRIGRGTGIRAQRFRRDARSAMEQSYAAVPCWIMPTWRISEFLPAALASFDLVIVDEASQSDIGALPALLRGKKVLIVGDDKQVSPTGAFVEERRLLQLKHNFLQNQPYGPLMLPGGSLYDLANAMFPGRRIMLHEHFRCVEPIIRFSMQFYTEPIIPLRIPKASERLDPPLIDVFVPHGRKGRGQVNMAEVEAIVDEIEKIIDDPSYEGRSIGVVSLIGSKQAHQIQTQLFTRIGEEAYFKHDITCGNPATFQGKERNIMFVSMVECPETQSAKTALLWQQRFNVAFSRARDRMYLFRSVDEDELNPDDLKAAAIRHFKSPMEITVSVGDDLIELCESEFERDVFRRLRDLGYRVAPQVSVARYAIDMVVEGAHDQRLAIELDGDKYHPPEQWIDDLVRQRTMERMGWRFWRCWGSSYYLDPDSCIDDLVQTLGSLGIEPLGSEAPRNVYTEHRVVEAPKVEAPDTGEAVGAEQQELPVVEEPALVVETMEPHREPRVADLLSVAPDAGEASTRAPSTPPTEVEDKSETIEVGDRVLIAYNDDTGRQYTIRISQTEHNPDMGVIRVEHQLAEALLGAVVDEELEIPAGGGKRVVTVVGIEKSTSTLQIQESGTHAPLDGAKAGQSEGAGETGVVPNEGEAVALPVSEAPLTLTEVPERLIHAHDFAQREEAGKAEEHLTAPGETREPPLHVGHTDSTQPYRAWNRHPLPDPRGEPHNEVADRLVEIIEAEGPVLLHRAFHLYTDAAGIKRIGNQLRSRFLRATDIALKSERIETEEGGDGTKFGLESVVRSAGCPPVILRTRGPRTFEELPFSEIKVVMRSLFQSHPTIDEETLYRRVLEFFDLKRLTSNVRNTLAPLASEEGLEFTEPNSLETDSEIAETASSSGKKYDFEIFGEPCSVDTLADVLVSVLLSIHKIDDNFLPRISRKSGRVRPILARDPQELYPGRHDLSHYSRKVADGWYVGTYYSKKDVARILGCICDVAGLVLGDDLSGPAIEDIKSHAQ